MPYLPLKLPPGISRASTKYDARGRWYDANLVRWHEGDMRPVGGWRPAEVLVETVPTPLSLGAAARGIQAWRTNTQAPYVAFGTVDEAFAYANGILTDITPVSFTAGLNDATMVTGNYGQGGYGAGLFGFGSALTGQITEAQSWAFDTFGQLLIACAYSDGKLYSWNPSGADPLTVLAGAPTSCLGVVVTPERFVVALGAGGDARALAWADQESLTDWTPTSVNQAGDFILASSGQIMAARRGRNETLIWTDTDMHVMRFIGGSLVYGFQQAGSSCGLTGRRAVGVEGGRAFWMSHNGFYMYDGTVRAIPCEVHSYVFDNINRTQISKVACDVRADFNEVTWYYPASTDENTRYVTFNYVTGAWAIGQLARTAAISNGVTAFPVAVAPNGNVYEHEVPGAGFPHHGGGAALVPFAESGPVELGAGDQVLYVREIVPDSRTVGDMSARLYSAFYPTAAESVSAVFNLANPTPVRLAGRWVRLRVDQVSSDWRLGTPRLEVVPGGLR
jgi:hypothetical protein